ncbi:MAG TPA: hypothetical protein VFP20_08450 [Bacteroidales bacterium]|nr:hypothetical protein [Bacteroidales bacterium]
MKKLDFKLIWGAFMSLVFLGMGVITLFTNYFSNMSATLRIVFGIVFLIFSIYRGYQIWSEIRFKK